MRRAGVSQVVNREVGNTCRLARLIKPVRMQIARSPLPTRLELPAKPLIFPLAKAAQAGDKEQRIDIQALVKVIVQGTVDDPDKLAQKLVPHFERQLKDMVGDVMVLLHGFIKKSQKTPTPDLDIARRRKATLRR